MLRPRRCRPTFSSDIICSNCGCQGKATLPFIKRLAIGNSIDFGSPLIVLALELLHDFGVLRGHVLGFAWIFHKVVKVYAFGDV